MVPTIAPQLVANNAVEALRAAISAPQRYAIEPKVDGVRGLLAFDGEGVIIRNRKGQVSERWLSCYTFLPVFAGVDLRYEPWQDRRVRLELLAQAFAPPLVLSPIVEPSTDLTAAIMDGYLEGIVLKDRTAEYRSGSRRGWSKVKSPDWFERHRARFRR